MTEPGSGRLRLSNRKYRTHLIVSFLSIAIFAAAALRLWGTELRGLPDLETYIAGLLYASGPIPLIFLIARRVFGSTVGGVAVLMLTLHGFHIYLGQTAPHYVAGVFLSLLASWLLFLLVRTRTCTPWLEAGYIAAVIAGTLVAEFFWLLIVVHLCWTILVLPRRLSLPAGEVLQAGFSNAPRMIQTQMIAVILAAPAISQSVYRAPLRAGQALSEDLLTEYLSFGFLFSKHGLTIPIHHAGELAASFLLAFALALLIAGLRAPKREAPLFALGKPLPLGLAIAAAVTSTAIMLWLTLIAERRTGGMIALTALPLIALGIPVLAATWRRHVIRLPSRSLSFLQERALFLWLMGIVSPLVLIAASCEAVPLAPATLMIFVPYYLILCAAGTVCIFQRRTFRWIIISLIVILFAGSLPSATVKPVTPGSKSDPTRSTPNLQRAD